MTKYELYKEIEETQKRLEKQIDLVLQNETDRERSCQNAKKDIE